jgi:hypothetical protein
VVRLPLPRVVAPALGLALLAACSSGSEEVCPGAAVAALSFGSGARVAAGDAALAGLDLAATVPDCPFPTPSGTQAPPAFPSSLPSFRATLAFDDFSQVAALCRPAKAVLYGGRAGTRYTVEGSTTGAVLDACAPSCSAILRAVVVGDVTLDGTGAATAFDGALTEIVTPVDGSGCGTCFPDPAGCAARYLLHGTP